MNFQRPVKKHSSFEIAPLVDVVFLLLLFFVLSYNAAVESTIKVLLPHSTEADQIVDDQIVITIQADGAIYLNDVLHPLSELTEALRTHRSESKQVVTIRADQKLAVLRLVNVVDATKKAGYLTFSIVTRADL